MRAGVAPVWDEDVDGTGVERRARTGNQPDPGRWSVAGTASITRLSGTDTGVGANDYPESAQGGGKA